MGWYTRDGTCLSVQGTHARTSRSRGADSRSDSSSKRAQLSTVTGSVFSHMVFMEDMPKRSDVTRSYQGQDIARTGTHTNTQLMPCHSLLCVEAAFMHFETKLDSGHQSGAD
jgi:hypothetical protein